MEPAPLGLPASRGPRPIGALLASLPGAALSVTVALAASFVAALHGGPPLLYALMFGMVLHVYGADPRSAPGLDLCAKHLLRLGIALLGARLTAAQIAALGWPVALCLVAAVATTVLCGLWLARRMKLPHTLGLLAGGATAICGASAALAIAAVLPRDDEPALRRQTLVVVVGATALSTLAMLLYPLLARALHLSPAMAGLFLGGSIHDVAQVVVAGYTLGAATGDMASVVKLSRVALLGAVVVLVGLAVRRDAGGRGAGMRTPLLPGFVLLFFAMVGLNSAGLFTEAAHQWIDPLSRACLVVAVAALGIKTSLGELARAGWQPLLLMVLCTLWIGGFTLAAALLLG
jgi:uncharacterized integral membrane protein (TIGR00698 family)